MAFPVSQFKDYIYNAAAAYKSQFGLNPPQPFVPDQNAARLFESYSASTAVANLVASRRGFNPATPYPWISGHPNQDMYGGNNWQRICAHDAGWSPELAAPVTLNGNCVAITRRHLLMSRHGSDVIDPPAYTWTLQWVTANGLTITRTTAPVWVDYIPTGGHFQFSFRMAYLSEDLPPYLVCPLLDVVDMPELIGVPVVCYNNYKEATVWEIVNENENSSSGFYRQFHVHSPIDPDPNNPTLSLIWRQFGYGDSQYGLLDYWGTAAMPQGDLGSGSPFFLVFTNSVGQTQFVYFGHLVTLEDYIDGVYYGAIGPSYKEYYNAIRAAVNTLNAESNGGKGRNLQPVTVTNTEWSSSLMNGLISYWKLNETSGVRVASHGVWGLPDVNSVGSTTGHVYPVAAEFFTENGEYLWHTASPILDSLAASLLASGFCCVITVRCFLR